MRTMSEGGVRLVVERPRDGLLTERVNQLSGWFEVAGGSSDFLLRAECAGHPIPLHEYLHPGSRERPTLRGFFLYLFPQDFAASLDTGWLDLVFFWGKRPLRRVSLKVAPALAELVRARPLSRRVYPVRSRSRKAPGTLKESALIFPGLGGVGGSSLNLLMRQLATQNGHRFPVHGEANDPALWAWMGPKLDGCRWIDGHRCYDAGSALKSRSARVTLLREPSRRMVSIFNYNSLVHPFEFRFSTFEEFIHSDAAKPYTQAHGLLRLAGRPPSRDESEATLYRAAMTELEESYAIVGITELFEESVFLICHEAGYPETLLWWRILSAPGFARLERLSSATRDRLRHITAVDELLYRDALDRFRRRVAECDFGDDLDRYRRDALSRLEISQEQKLAECLRWRQLLTDDELLMLRSKTGRR